MRRAPVLAGVLVALFAAAASAAEPAPLPKPASFTAYDTPYDDGKKVSAEWAGAENERVEAKYVVSISPRKTGPFAEAWRGPSTTARKVEDTATFGPWHGGDAKAHHVAVSPLATYKTQTLAQLALDDKPRANPTDTIALLLRLPERLEWLHLFGKETLDRARKALVAANVKRVEDLQAEGVQDIEKDLSDIILGEGHAFFGLGRKDRPFYLKLEVVEDSRKEQVGDVAEARPAGNLFNRKKLNNFLAMLFFGGAVLGMIRRARSNPDMYLRRIGGLEAVDEALGRATEMGKPVLFAHGLETMQSISTIAAINVLGEVTKRVAKFDTKMICVNNDPVVFAVSQETVKEAYLHAGRPDAYNPDDVIFVAAEQFSYVAAVSGIMMRQQPAANIYMGYFYAESLLLAETGASTGAIQIAGTDSYTQLPFFITTCDYTLMGEELYAASAYLSRNPMLLGSLKGQDIGKAVLMAIVLIGTTLATLGIERVTRLIEVYQ